MFHICGRPSLYTCNYVAQHYRHVQQESASETYFEYQMADASLAGSRWLQSTEATDTHSGHTTLLPSL